MPEPMKKYKTSEIARLTGVHPNTIRIYENVSFLKKAERQKNGYRVFSELDLEQVRLVRLALKCLIVQNGLRKQAVQIAKTAASGEIEKAIELTREYKKNIDTEKRRAEEAIKIVNDLFYSSVEQESGMTRKQTAKYLQITIDTLRNWEMNGLLSVKRKKNGYRIYSNEEILRLKVIRSLRCANYSLAAILRMLNDFDNGLDFDLKKSIDTPKKNETVISACDRLLSSLTELQEIASQMLIQLEKMQKYF